MLLKTTSCSAATCALATHCEDARPLESSNFPSCRLDRLNPTDLLLYHIYGFLCLNADEKRNVVRTVSEAVLVEFMTRKRPMPSLNIVGVGLPIE